MGGSITDNETWQAKHLMMTYHHLSLFTSPKLLVDKPHNICLDERLKNNFIRWFPWESVLKNEIDRLSLFIWHDICLISGKVGDVSSLKTVK